MDPRIYFLVRGLAIVLGILATAHPALSQSPPQEPSTTLKVGFGIADITPRRPTPMAGYYGVRYSTATHDPLWAKATVFDDGSTRVAIISVDLISTNPWMVRETRKRIEEKLQIPPSHVMISATHSHTGPMLYEPDEQLLERFGNQTDEAKQYMIGLPERIAQSVFDAAASLKPRSVAYAVGEEKQLAFNRRFFMKDGTVGWNPGKLNPNIVREAGPTDDSLPFVAFYDEPGKIAGLLSSFAIHLDTVGGTEWSADMPYTIQECLRKVFGDAAHLQYATGACGDINHIDVRSGNRQGGHQEAARIGTRVAAAILRSWNQLQPTRSQRLAASHQIIRVPVNPHTPERSSWAKSVLAKMNDKPLPPFMEMVEAYRIADVEARPDGFIDAEVQVITLGREVAWVALPGEIFVQLGIAIKDASPFAVTSIHELASGSIGYVPTRQAYAQGNYEVISARCAEGSGELMVDSAITQLREQFNSKP
jgi:neutral ceramidase